MSAWDRLALHLYSRTRIRRNQAAFLEWMNQIVESVQLPPKEARAAFSRIESECADMKSSSNHSFAAMLVPALAKVMDSHYRRQAYLDCAVIAIACERYRLKHNRWPDTLAELVPEYLDRMATDPFSDAPLRYRSLDDGIVIYSVGEDGNDDNGTLDRQRRNRDGADIGIRLWDGKHRRQPPAPVNPDEP